MSASGRLSDGLIRWTGYVCQKKKLHTKHNQNLDNTSNIQIYRTISIHCKEERLSDGKNKAGAR